MPPKCMFTLGKVVPSNLKVDDGNVALSSTGGTTQSQESRYQEERRRAVIWNNYFFYAFTRE